MSRDLGDFQTPPRLIAEILACLGPIGKRWPRVLEPTCGTGGFITGLLNVPSPPHEIQGFELQEVHTTHARGLSTQSATTSVHIQQANIFDLDLRRDIHWHESGPLLVLGNPPWVTNAALGALGSANLPRKSNIKHLPGLAAKTGGANFDIAEFIWIKLLRELADQRPTVALLCKTSVARNILQFAHDTSLPIAASWLRRVDARKHFGAAVDACLFYVEVGSALALQKIAIYDDLLATVLASTMAYVEGRLVARADGTPVIAPAVTRSAEYGLRSVRGSVDALEWRQGVKHDAIQIMELRSEGTHLWNKRGEVVEIEPAYCYPLLKSSDLFHGRVASTSRSVILPQRRIGEDTRSLRIAAPALWQYLSRHADALGRRRSSIYRGQPPFAIFGIGAYAFAPYKVGISGFYKTPRFRCLGSINELPVMLDDTCYFLPCASAERAALIAAILNHPVTLDLIASLTFVDAKRPITKKLLQSLDLVALVRMIDREELVRVANEEVGRLLDVRGHIVVDWPKDLSDLLRDKGPALDERDTAHYRQHPLFAT